MKCSDGKYFEPLQVNIGDDTTETFLDKILAAATICRQQHLANMKRLTQEKWRELQQRHKLLNLHKTIRVSR